MSVELCYQRTHSCDVTWLLSGALMLPTQTEKFVRPRRQIPETVNRNQKSENGNQKTAQQTKIGSSVPNPTAPPPPPLKTRPPSALSPPPFYIPRRVGCYIMHLIIADSDSDFPQILTNSNSYLMYTCLTLPPPKSLFSTNS